MDPSSDPSSLLASLTMGTEVEVQFGKSLQARPFPLRQRGSSLFRLFGFFYLAPPLWVFASGALSLFSTGLSRCLIQAQSLFQSLSFPCVVCILF